MYLCMHMYLQYKLIFSHTIHIHSIHMHWYAMMYVWDSSKSFKLGFSSTWTENLQMWKLDLEKAEEPEIKLPTSTGSQRKQGRSRKPSAPLHWRCQSLWLCASHRPRGKFFKRWEHQATLAASWETCMQVAKQQSGSDTEQRTGSKRSTSRLCILTLLIELTCRVHHSKCRAGWITNWNQDCQEKYQQPQIGRWHRSNARKWWGTEEPLDEGERGEWKVGLKLSVQKTKIWSHHFTVNRRGKSGNSISGFSFPGL